LTRSPEQLKDKTKLFDGVPVAEVVSKPKKWPMMDKDWAALGY
jgi:hypothetical protein